MASANSTRTSAQFNRRSLLALPAALAVGAVPVAAAETPVMKLFRQWKADSDRLDVLEGASDEEWSDQRAALSATEDRILSLPAQGPMDVVMKALVLTVFGTVALDEDKYRPDFWAEARALVAA